MSDIPPYSSGGEFLYDDDGSPLPILDAFNDATGAIDGHGAAEPTEFLAVSPPVTLAKTPISPDSANGSGDSISDSSSSKRTTSTASTTLTNGDVMMTDTVDDKVEWKFTDFVHTEEDGLHDTMFSAPGETLPLFENKDKINFGGMGPGGSMGSFTGPKEEYPLPLGSSLIGAAINSTSADAAAAPRSFHGSSFALAQSMYGLSTNGSREVSPQSTMNPSQGSSPAPFLNSPPAAESFSFTHGPGFHPPWPGALNMEMGMQTSDNALPGAMTGSLATTLMFPQAVYGPGPHHLKVASIPHKSRVETQIPIKLTMTTLPVGVKKLHLPTHTISKPKLLAKPTPEPSRDTLELFTVLVCTSAMHNPDLKEKALRRAQAAAAAGRKSSAVLEDAEMDELKPQDGGDVQICAGCITRERKRAARKKVKKPEDERLWLQDESKRVIVFNTQEVKEWQQVQPEPDQSLSSTGFHIDAPMRIACYCRHHGEKSGFQVIFTITDHAGNFVAQSMSPSIMITDDHKTHLGPTAATAPDATAGQVQSSVPEMEASLSPPGGSFRPSLSGSDVPLAKRSTPANYAQSTPSPGQTHLSPGPTCLPTPRNLSRPASPTGVSGPCKKRKSSGSSKVPSGLAMTRLDTNPTQPSGPPAAGGAPSSTPSPFSPSIGTFSAVSEQGPFSSSVGSITMPTAPLPQTFGAGPTTPNMSEQPLFGGMGGNLDNLAMTNMYSAPASTRPSRAPSPNSSLRANALLQPNGTNFAQAVANLSGFHGLPMPVPALATPPAVIHKIIPAEGPKSGGIEVTVLGGGFYQGLEIMFGDVKATTTTYWGETSLVCLLPPSPVAGTVGVSFKTQLAQSPPHMTRPHPTFNYIDDDEQQLIRTALAVLGQKMNGTFEDARVLARRIIGENGGAWGASSSGGNPGARSGSFANFTFDMSFESQLLKILELIDLDDSTHKPRFNLRRSTGQTMLHLACSLGLHRFVAGLLARGANPDIRDKGGYTPLHMAALNDHPEIVRRLISYGADPTLRTLSGLTAADVAKSRAVLRAIRRVERHARSQSGGSLHSRASSANSLKSLWEPATAAHSGEDRAENDETTSGEESPEYTSGDMASEDEGSDADDDMWLDMRRTKTHTVLSQETPPAGEAHGALASPSAAVTALRDQFSAQIQQFQQAMALHFQNLPQFPNFPQIPNMHPLPEYQAAVMQRLASMVPNIGAFRPPTAGDGTDPTSAKELETRWWDLSSLVTSSAPPPSYEEIFPPDELDKKQASAAQAAAEAEADSKCALLYDQQTVHVSTSATSTASTSAAPREANQKLPALLQIGRKNAITREQQENLRRAHAERLKRLSRDRNLFFIWIPLLIIVLCAMLYNRFPGMFLALGGFLSSLIFTSPAAEAAAAAPVVMMPDRVVEVV